MSDAAIFGAIICNSILRGFPGIGYWALLYKLPLVQEIAAISILYFGLNILSEIYNLIKYVFPLCFKTDLTTLIQVFAIWAFFFGIRIWGLFASIYLFNSGIRQCPTEKDRSCGLSIVLFGISLFAVSFKRYNGGGSRLSH